MVAHISLRNCLLACICILPTLWGMKDEYYPIVEVQGLRTFDESAYQDFNTKLDKEFPGIEHYQVKVGSGALTELYMGSAWDVLKKFDTGIQAVVQKFIKNRKYILVGQSWGAGMARFWLEHYSYQAQLQQVVEYYGICGIQDGYYGVPDGSSDFIKNALTAKNLAWLAPLCNTIVSKGYPVSWPLMYSCCMQNKLAFPGIWKDPRHPSLYLRKCRFLPILNNLVAHASQDSYKLNLSSLKRLHFISSDNDPVIKPHENSIFLKPGQVCFEQTPYYQDDLLGIKTLYNQKDVTFDTFTAAHECQSDPNIAAKLIEYIRFAQRERIQKKLPLTISSPI